MKKIVIVFDGDDTLWMTEWMYSKAIANFCSYIYDIFGYMAPDFNTVHDLFVSVNRDMYVLWGVERGRLSQAMIKTYHRIFEYCRIKWGQDACSRIESDSKEHEYRIFKLGDDPFDFRQHIWVDGAQDTLDCLKSRGYKLCLLTCYDSKTWKDKSQFLGIARYADSIKAVPTRKTMEDFVEVSGYNTADSNGALFYAIGNGKSDILPAIEISERWRGVYVPHGSTSIYHDKGTSEGLFSLPVIDHPAAITVRSILELKTFDFENFKPNAKSV